MKFVLKIRHLSNKWRPTTYRAHTHTPRRVRHSVLLDFFEMLQYNATMKY